MARRYNLDKKDIKDAGKVVLYSMIASGIGAIIIVVGNLDVPAQWLFIVPILNTLLVSGKDYFENRSEE